LYKDIFLYLFYLKNKIKAWRGCFPNHILSRR